MADWINVDVRALRTLKVGDEFKDFRGREGRIVDIVSTDNRPYKVEYKGPDGIYDCSFRGDLTIVAYREALLETDWITFPPRRLREISLEPGDLFRRYMDHTNFKFIRWTDPEHYEIQEVETGRIRLSSGNFLVSAYKKASSSSSISHPSVTEVVCSSCGRLLGEFSDGTTPRSILGKCCKGTSVRWSEDKMEEWLRLVDQE